MEPIAGSRSHGRAALAAAAGWVLAAGAMTGCVLPAPEPGPRGGGAATECGGTAGQLVVELVNGVRARHGLGPFRVHGDLVEAALRHSRDQAAVDGEMGHIGSDDSAPGDRVAAAGYPWALVSENVAAGYASASSVVTAWLNSPPHRGTILSPRAIHAGVGYIRAPTASMRHFWTLNVAAPQESVARGELACHP